MKTASLLKNSSAPVEEICAIMAPVTFVLKPMVESQIPQLPKKYFVKLENVTRRVKKNVVLKLQKWHGIFSLFDFFVNLKPSSSFRRSILKSALIGNEISLTYSGLFYGQADIVPFHFLLFTLLLYR